MTGAELERLPLPDNFRAVVEGVGPTKREQKTKLARPNITPRNGQGGSAPRADAAGGDGRKPVKPKRKHSSRAGRPQTAGENSAGGAAGGRPQRRRRFGGGRGRG